MIILKCDKCKKEIDKGYDFTLRARPYTIKDFLENPPIFEMPFIVQKKVFCKKCFNELLQGIDPELKAEE